MKKMVHTRKYPLPITNRIKFLQDNNLITDEEVLKNIKGTYPIINAKTFGLAERFLQHKRKHGSDKEKAVYDALFESAKQDKESAIRAFFTRLLSKRPLTFTTSADHTKLRKKIDDHDVYFNATVRFDDIGTEKEETP